MLRKTNLMAIMGVAAMLSYGQAFGADTPDSKNADQAKKDQAAQPSTADQDQKVDMNKLSEAFGHFIGRNLNSPGIKFDLESIIKGMRDGAAGKPAPMSDQEYEAMMIKVQEQAFKQLAEDNLKAANEFLTKNAKEDKVVVLEPGKLQYVILQEGKGPAVTEHSTPQIQYTGKYIDGTVFGSSEQSGGPITIPLDQTIPGFSKGILNMKEGEKRRLFVHPDLGYGTSGHLPPNALLIFDIELVKANSAKEQSGDAKDAELLPLAIEEDIIEVDDEDDMPNDQVQGKAQGSAQPTTQSAGSTKAPSASK